MLNRRDFSKIISIAITMPSFIFSSCKKALAPTNYAFTKSQKLTLYSIHEHLFPSDANSPGASDINSVEWLIKLLADPQISDTRKRMMLRGINWVNETSQTLYSKPFNELSNSEKEETLLDLKSYVNGERWLSYNITYILEALLADPIYEVNTKETGWNWLKHKTGYPRPTIRTKYQYL